MPNQFRGKSKRKTGPKTRVGGCLFFGFFFLIGSAVFTGFFWGVFLPAWRANTKYVEGRCVVLDKRIVEIRDDGTTYRPEIHIKYTVSGREFQIWTYDAAKVSSSGRAGKQNILDQFTVGKEYPCWHDPDDPSKAVLVRGFSWTMLLPLFPLIFVVIGLVGMVYSLRGGSTKERKPADSDFGSFDATAPAGQSGGGSELVEFPTVPVKDLSDQPGKTLKYRLSPSISPGCALIGILVGGIFWNGMVSVFVTLAVRSHLAGKPEWFLTIFLIPFVLIGIGIVFAFFRQLLVTTGVGPTEAEISDHPLRPGGAYQLFVSQSGNLQMNDLRVLLVCEEAATYRQGTSTSTDTRRVFEQELFRNEAFEIQKGLPYETRCELLVPPGAMHSFEVSNNKIKWKIVIAGDVAGWPNFERDYPVVVLPASAAENSA